MLIMAGACLRIAERSTSGPPDEVLAKDTGLSAEILSLRGAVLDVLSPPYPRRATSTDSPLRHRVDSARHHAPHRLARPGSRLGDRGPRNHSVENARRQAVLASSPPQRQFESREPARPSLVHIEGGYTECHTTPTTYWIEIGRCASRAQFVETRFGQRGETPLGVFLQIGLVHRRIVATPYTLPKRQLHGDELGW